MIARPVLKTVGITAFITTFFLGYFELLESPRFPVTVMPLTAIDHLIAFAPFSLPIYLSLWVYVCFPPIALRTRRELVAYGWESAAVALIGLGVFLFWPTVIPSPGIDWTQHPSFLFLKNVDAAGNACPSLHVAFAVFSAIRAGRIFRGLSSPPIVNGLNWLWCLAIVYSTLATRQHVALDAAAGAVLGTLGGLLPWAARARMPGTR